MSGQLMYSVVRKIRGGPSNEEFLGEGNIDLVRKIEVRRLVSGMTIEVWGGSRFRQSYKGTVKLWRDGLPVWESSKKVGWTYTTEVRYIKPNGKLGGVVL